MTTHWSPSVLGALLLLWPADRLLSPAIELRSFDCFQTLGPRLGPRPWWWVPVLWLDPLRGFFGTLLLMRAFDLGAPGWTLLPDLSYAGLVAVLAVAVLCQLFTTRETPRALLAPIGFAVGMMAALTTWQVAALVTTTAWLGMFTIRQFHGFFATGAGAVLVFGYVTDLSPIWIWPAAGALALPALVVLVSGKSLELPTHSTSLPAPPPASGGGRHRKHGKF